MQICLHFIQRGIGLLEIYYCTLILKKKLFSTNRAPQTLGEKLEEEKEEERKSFLLVINHLSQP